MFSRLTLFAKLTVSYAPRPWLSTTHLKVTFVTHSGLKKVLQVSDNRCKKTIVHVCRRLAYTSLRLCPVIPIIPRSLVSIAPRCPLALRTCLTQTGWFPCLCLVQGVRMHIRGQQRTRSCRESDASQFVQYISCPSSLSVLYLMLPIQKLREFQSKALRPLPCLI